VIILDTNIISEAARTVPNPDVMEWVDRQPRTELFLAAPSVAELRRGIEKLPPSRRRSLLEAAIERILERMFQDRFLPFDRDTAAECGVILAERERQGRPAGIFDAMIAATARVHGATIATRDVAGFSGLGLALVNPFGPG